jgi:hypothetical protein
VLSAPEQRGLGVLLGRLDQELFRRPEAAAGLLQDVAPLPLEGRKLHVHIDWSGETPPR